MTKFKIILSELSIIWKNIENRLTCNYGCIEYDNQNIKIRGMIRRDQNIEGFGQITVGRFIYFGHWVNSEILVNYFVGDEIVITDQEVIFAQVKWEKKNITNNLSLTTHFIITQESINNMDKYNIYLPIVYGAKLYMEVLDGSLFDIEIDSSKPLDKFFITSSLQVNSLTTTSTCVDDETMYVLTLTIKKDKLKYERQNIKGNSGNFIFDYPLKSAIGFLETVLFRLPKEPKNIQELKRYLY